MAKNLPASTVEALAERILGLSGQLRYVALYRDGILTTRSRTDLEAASAAESDRYEELFVNPGVLCLLIQRGRLDCGGLDHVLIRYGSFWQFIQPIRGGHVSVCIAADADPIALISTIKPFLHSLHESEC